jgi:hypothetical protein
LLQRAARNGRGGRVDSGEEFTERSGSLLTLNIA